MRAKGKSNDWIILSAYLDGEMTAREKEKLEQRLRASPQLKEQLEELRSTRAMIRALPRKKAPRNFVLTPEMVRERKKSGWLPALGLTSAASALIVILLLFIQFGPGLLSGGMMPPREPQQEVAMYSQDSAEEAAEEAPAEGAGPEIVYWGGPPPLVYAEGKGGGSSDILMQPAPYGTGGEQPMPEAVREPLVGEQEQPAEEAAPPVELQAAPVEESLEAPQVKMGDEEFNPILGVRPTDEAALLMRIPDNVPVEEPGVVEKVSTVLIVLLGGISVATGLSAYILWRRMR